MAHNAPPSRAPRMDEATYRREGHLEKPGAAQRAAEAKQAHERKKKRNEENLKAIREMAGKLGA